LGNPTKAVVEVEKMFQKALADYSPEEFPPESVKIFQKIRTNITLWMTGYYL
jgi:hypothetical protein